MADVGRPEVITKAVLHKLEEVFSLGGTDKEACVYAGIAPSTLYNYQKDNQKFVERKELLKQNPILLARQTVNKALKEDAQTARWYLERRDQDFKPKSESKVTQEKTYRLEDADAQKLADDLTELQKTNAGTNTGSPRTEA